MIFSILFIPWSEPNNPQQHLFELFGTSTYSNTSTFANFMYGIVWDCILYGIHAAQMLSQFLLGWKCRQVLPAIGEVWLHLHPVGKQNLRPCRVVMETYLTHMDTYGPYGPWGYPYIVHLHRSFPLIINQPAEYSHFWKAPLERAPGQSLEVQS